MGEQKEKQAQQVQIDIKRTVPLFADNVIVANLVRSDNEKANSKKKKEGHLAIIFVDTLTKQAISRIIVSRQTAEGMLKTLGESLSKFDKDVSNREVKVKSEPAARTRYLG
jgi:CHASE3 domain sensor protein